MGLHTPGWTGFWMEMLQERSAGRVDAVSVHPYRNWMPENMIADYQRLRAPLTTPGTVPAYPLSTEFGMTTWGGEGSYPDERLEQRQAAICSPATGTVHCYLGAPAVWYTTQDGSTDPNAYGMHFGFLRADLTPKPAYTIRPERQPLPGRLPLLGAGGAESEGDWLLLFEKQEERCFGFRLAAWTTGLPRSDGTPAEGESASGWTYWAALALSADPAGGTPAAPPAGSLPHPSAEDGRRCWPETSAKAGARLNMVEAGAARASADAPR